MELKDDGEGEQQGGASAGQGGGRPDVEHLQVFVVFFAGSLKSLTGHISMGQV